jgi:tetratricopeptide (TPR) repeat protein
MLTATHGEPLSAILNSVVRHIAQWDEGQELLEALGTVVALESRKNHKGEHFFCSQRLFQEVMNCSRQQERRLCARLTGEVKLTPRGGYRIETRHPVIAETLFPILFRGDAPLLDELEIHDRLVRAAGHLSKEHVNPGERKLLTVLPLAYAREKNWDQARKLFRRGTEADPQHAPVWQAWAMLEKEQGNVGSMEKKYTARWLFRRGTEAAPQHASVWQAWAIMEYENGNRDQAEMLVMEGLSYCPNDLSLQQFQGNLANIPGLVLVNEIRGFLAAGECARAGALLKEALFTEPSNPKLLELHRLWRERCAER